jgi:hypothetical protein
LQTHKPATIDGCGRAAPKLSVQDFLRKRFESRETSDAGKALCRNVSQNRSVRVDFLGTRSAIVSIQPFEQSEDKNQPMASLCQIDDKHVPLYRVLWVSNLPHYCGEEGCEAEGRYEVRLEQNESLFGTLQERDNLLKALAQWHGVIDDGPTDEDLNEEDDGGTP